MENREKVKKGLQAHAEGCGYRSNYCDFMECPYRIGDKSCDIEQMCIDALALLKEPPEDVEELRKERDELGEDLNNAVELIHKKNERIEKLLKEQEAVEPYQHDAVWICGNCDKEEVGWDDPITGEEIRYPFCRECGRSVKWK